MKGDNMQDRVSLYPGRVKLEPVAGQANTYDLTRADQPTQEGTPLNKASLLKDSTAALLGLPKTAVPDDAFVSLVLGQGIYGYRVKVQLADGTPVEGAVVSGIQPLTGSTLVTGADGTVLGKSASASVTIGCTSPYIDQKAPAAQTVTKTGTITDVTLTLENDTSLMLSRLSKIYKLSPAAKAVDLCATGGGGGGSISSGGGGGYTENLMNVNLFSHSLLKFEIGSGGQYDSTTQNGKDGGATAVYLDNEIILQALGGKGGIGGGNGGAGNGNGGGDSNHNPVGGNATVPIFNDTTIGIKTGGGGGGGGGRKDADGEVGIGYPGLPNGGKGAYLLVTISKNTHIPAEPGSDGGGGGGGYDKNWGGVAAGGNGIVYFRFHFAT
jgi:hypothetical protein